MEGGTWERLATPFVLGSCVCTLLASVLTEGEWVGGESSAALQWRCCLSFPLALSGHQTTAPRGQAWNFRILPSPSAHFYENLGATTDGGKQVPPSLQV